jgi:hypothetical protein
VADIDAFARQLWEEAKALLEKARATTVVECKKAYLHAALNLGFCSFEAHINSVASDFLTIEDLTPHERSILSEQRIELENGQFRVSGSFQMYRLEDRLLFLRHRFSKNKPLDRTAAYWGNFKQALDLRNSLTHPKAPPPKVTEQSVDRALHAILKLLDVTYQRIYNRKYPTRERGLESTVEL